MRVAIDKNSALIVTSHFKSTFQPWYEECGGLQGFAGGVEVLTSNIQAENRGRDLLIPARHRRAAPFHGRDDEIEKIFQQLEPRACKMQNVRASEVGVCSTGKSFRFVRVCVRMVWEPRRYFSEIVRRAFPFSLLSSFGLGALSPFLVRSK